MNSISTLHMTGTGVIKYVSERMKGLAVEILGIDSKT